MSESGHVAVLGREVVGLLSPRAGEVVVDCTVGRGGHSRMLAEAVGAGGRVIGLDMDPGNAAYAGEALAGCAARVDVVHANFRYVREALAGLGVERVDVLLADLGFSSTQLAAGRGMSFDDEGLLDMRMDPTQSVTAAELVNEMPERELADVIFQYGEERLSRKIARKIVAEREQRPISTCNVLADLVRRAYGPLGRQSRIDPATRTFMALRIAVNGELESLDELLRQLPAVMKPGGRAGIISFHSLEDRKVKQSFVALVKEGLAEKITGKPVVAGEAESRENPRSRSAKFRVIRMKEVVGGAGDEETQESKRRPWKDRHEHKDVT